MNKNCSNYCITLIRCLMREEAIPQMPEGVTPEELYAFAQLHAIEAMVYHGLERCRTKKDHPIWKNWRSRADLLLTQSIVQLAERDALFAAFPTAGIPILPVKGCWLKEQYPDIDYRQMSDLDILIHPEDAEKARAIMVSMGYTPEERASDHHDEYSKPPYMGVELHTSLLPKDDSRYSYYLSVWERAVPAAEHPGVSRLRAEDEYIFFLLHLYKHIYYAGTGLRPFLDSTVYRRLWPDMDRAYLQKEYEKLGLTVFAAQVEQLSDCWFESGEKIPAALEPLAESVLSSSVYGTEAQRRHHTIDKLGRKYRSRFLGWAVYWLGRLFAPLREMKPQYPVLEKYPWLLPVFWGVHLVKKLTRDPRDILQSFRKATHLGGNNGKDTTGWNSDSNE